MIRAGRPTATTSLGSSVPGSDEGAFAEEDAVTEAGPGHEDRGVADLAQVADGRADDEAAMAEHLRRPIVVGMAAVPMTTQFSITAEPVPMAPAPDERTTAPSDRKLRSPKEGCPIDDCR